MPKPRSQLQSYEHFVEYLLREDWAALMSATHNFTAKLAALTSRLTTIGLKNPSCPTFAHMAAVMLIACQHTNHEVGQPTSELLQRYLAMVKAAWRKQSTKTPCSNRLDSLPSSHLVCRQRHPGEYAIMFPEGDASTCPPSIPWSQVQLVASLIKLRNGVSTCVGSTGTPSAAQAPLPLAYYPHHAAAPPMLAIADRSYASDAASASSAGAGAGAVAADARCVQIAQVWLGFVYAACLAHVRACSTVIKSEWRSAYATRRFSQSVGRLRGDLVV